MLTTQSDSILQDIVAKYGSLQEPDFGFQVDAMAKRPFAALVDELMVHFFIKDTTHGQDASFVYVLRHGDQERILHLSMIGGYGVLFRTGENGLSLVEPSEQNVSWEDEVIRHLARKYKVSLLGRSVLTQRVPLRLFHAEPKNVRFFHALFSEGNSELLMAGHEEAVGMAACG
jgi:hypothetical protein